MGKITINELHKSIFDYAQAVSDKDLMTENKTIVGAINEIYGKNLIADSIGEPLNNTDTYSKMSNDIDNLLSTFKTNMMNAGIVVESEDKFKALIDKIATLVDSEGKGIRYAEINLGAITLPKYDGYTLGKLAITINYNERDIDFIPSIVFVHYGTIGIMGSNFNKTFTTAYNLSATIDEINNKGFVLNAQNTYEYERNIGDVIIYLIGVGEEDTTLRDSLASILQDEGVEVTEEDDMASLIIKVDEEFDRKNNEIENSGGLDIISATELPATGKENQICVITNNPIDNFLITTDFNDTQSTSAICIYLGDAEDVLPSSALTITKGNITNNYYFNRICQQNKRLASYHYANNQWNLLTKFNIPVYENGSFPSEDVLGVSPVKTSESGVFLDGNEIFFGTANYAIRGFTFPNIIDFSSYHKVTIVARLFETSSVVGTLYIASMKQHYTSIIDLGTNTLSTSYAYNWVTNTVSSETAVALTFDISSFTGSGYLGIVAGGSRSQFYIQEIILE